MDVLGLLAAGKYSNLQMNYISRLLTSLFILSTLFPPPMCQEYSPRVVFFPDAANFLHTHPPYLFISHVLHLCRFGSLDRIHDSLLNGNKRTEVSFTSCVVSENRFSLRESSQVLQAVSQTEVFLVVKELQKQACHLAGIFYK